MMRRAKPQPVRNKIDLGDPTQIRAWSRRLGITADELKVVVAKVGNSITGVSKEIDLRKAIPDPKAIPTAPVRIDPVSVPTGEAVAADARPAVASS
jgi:hypothetical protein